MSNEISHSLIQEVLDGQELSSQWSEQLTGFEEATTEHAETADRVPTKEASFAEGPSAVDEHRIPSADADELVELPQPLHQLISTTGVKLVAVPDGTWNIDGYEAKLRRPLSVTFDIDSVVTSEEVLEAFCNAGITAEEIKSIQYRGSNRSGCVSFVSRAAKVRILERGIVRFGNVSVFVGDAAFKTVIVKLYEAPPEMPDTVLIGRLSHYGRILSFRRDVGGATGILVSALPACGFRRRFLLLFGSPSRSCMYLILANPGPVDDVVRRVMLRKAARSLVATIAKHRTRGI